MARRPDPRETEMLSRQNLAELRHNLAHPSLPSVREFYDRAPRLPPHPRAAQPEEGPDTSHDKSGGMRGTGPTVGSPTV